MGTHGQMFGSCVTRSQATPLTPGSHASQAKVLFSYQILFTHQLGAKHKKGHSLNANPPLREARFLT